MSYLQVANNASSILAAAISDSATELTVASGEGARFPSSNFPVTVDSEIMKCTSRTGDVLTVVRAQEGTAAAPHALDAAVRLNITRAIIDEIQTGLDAKSKVVWKDTDYLCVSTGDITSSVGWTDCDITAYTSENAKFAILSVWFYQSTVTGTSGASTISLRKNGTTPSHPPGVGIHSAEPNNTDKGICLVLALDASQVFEYKVDVATGATVWAAINIIGYIE